MVYVSKLLVSILSPLGRWHPRFRLNWLLTQRVCISEWGREPQAFLEFNCSVQLIKYLEPRTHFQIHKNTRTHIHINTEPGHGWFIKSALIDVHRHQPLLFTQERHRKYGESFVTKPEVNFAHLISGKRFRLIVYMVSRGMGWANVWLWQRQALAIYDVYTHIATYARNPLNQQDSSVALFMAYSSKTLTIVFH